MEKIDHSENDIIKGFDVKKASELVAKMKELKGAIK